MELFLYPVRARHRLVESISSCLRQLGHMESALAIGVHGPVSRIDLRSASVQTRFDSARAKAQDALSAAETFLPFALVEPRLRGSFRPLYPVYEEMVFVLRQIVDRMDAMLRLRVVYGSEVLEAANPRVYLHRRAAAASIALLLFGVDAALSSRHAAGAAASAIHPPIPMPQFVSSSRLAQLRLVRRVQELVAAGEIGGGGDEAEKPQEDEKGKAAEGAAPDDARTPPAPGHDDRLRWLSWSASAAGQMELIEYLEELVDLARLLLGVNAFRAGILERPSYRARVRRIRKGGGGGGTGAHAHDDAPPSPHLEVAVSDPSAYAADDTAPRGRRRRSSALTRATTVTSAAAAAHHRHDGPRRHATNASHSHAAPLARTATTTISGGGGGSRRRAWTAWLPTNPHTLLVPPQQTQRQAARTDDGRAAAAARRELDVEAVEDDEDGGGGSSDDGVPGALRRIRTRRMQQQRADAGVDLGLAKRRTL